MQTTLQRGRRGKIKETNEGDHFWGLCKQFWPSLHGCVCCLELSEPSPTHRQAGLMAIASLMVAELQACALGAGSPTPSKALGRPSPCSSSSRCRRPSPCSWCVHGSWPSHCNLCLCCHVAYFPLSISVPLHANVPLLIKTSATGSGSLYPVRPHLDSMTSAHTLLPNKITVPGSGASSSTPTAIRYIELGFTVLKVDFYALWYFSHNKVILSSSSFYLWYTHFECQQVLKDHRHIPREPRFLWRRFYNIPP